MRALWVLAACAIPSWALAQPIPYVVSTDQAPFVPLSGATLISPSLGDSGTARISLPFDFQLYGQSYRTLWVNANGLVAVGDIGFGNNFPPLTNPSPGAPNGFIAPLWGDWCAAPDFSCGGALGRNDTGVYYAIDATPGAGSITIEWRGLRSFTDFNSSSDCSFQLRLFEGLASELEIHYGVMNPGTSFDMIPSDLSSRIGLESADGHYGMWFGPCAGNAMCDTAMVAALANQRFHLIADAGEDLAWGSLAVPSTGYPGLPLPVTAQYLNRHQTALGPTQVALVLLDAASTSTRGASELFRSAPITLSPFEARAIDATVALPENLAPGRYKIALIADVTDALAESLESNNVLISGAIRVVERAPDLSVTTVRPLVTTVAPGGSLPIAWRVDNRGNAPGHARLNLYLSTNSAITPTDEVLGTPIDVDLAGGASATATTTVQIADPHASGPFSVGAIVDFAGALPELDEANNVGLAAQSILVESDTLSIATTDLPVGTLTQSYQAAITAVGGNGRVQITLASGTLPRGLSFSAGDGSLFGIPVEAGTFPLSFHAESGGHSADRALDLVILDPTLPLTIVTEALPPAVVGSDYAVPIAVVGGQPPLRWRLRGSLPDGLSLGTDGVIFGAPSRPGPAEFVVQVLDDLSSTASTSLSLDVRAPANLTVPNQVLPHATVDTEYSATLLALGGVSPLRWSADASLPAGLSMTEIGELAGAPEAVGEFDFSVSVQDSAGKVDTNRFTLVVEPKLRMRIVTDALPDVIIGQPYRTQIRVEGGKRPYTWTVVEAEGRMPPGMTASPGDPSLPNESSNDLALAGTVNEAGVWAFTVKVRDGQGQVQQRALAMVSHEAPVTAPPKSGGCQDVGGASGGSILVALGLGTWALLLGRRRRHF